MDRQNRMMNYHQYTGAEKPARRFLLPGLLALSAALHLCAVIVWPLKTEHPVAGLRQLTLEIIPRDTQDTQPSPASMKNLRNIAKQTARPLEKTVTSATTRIVQHLSDVNKPAEPPVSATRQPRKFSSTEIREKLNGRIQQALLPHFTYPAIARRRGWEGTVKISLRVENDGRLTNLHVIARSKFDALNRAALHSLQQVSGIPEAKQWLAGHHVDMVLPVQYRLLDS